MEELQKMATSPIQTSAELKRSNSARKISRPVSPRASQAAELKSRLDSYRKDKSPAKDEFGRPLASTRTPGGLPRTSSTRNARSVSPRSKASGPSPRGAPLISRTSSKGSLRSPSTPTARKGFNSIDSSNDEEEVEEDLDLAVEVVVSGEDKETDVPKLTEIYNATLNRYGTKDLKKRSFAVLIKKVCFHSYLSICVSPCLTAGVSQSL
jgi:hypothetical protein